MGAIARLLSFTRQRRRGASVSDVKADPGGTPNVTAEHFAPAGDDSHPLPADYVAVISAAGTGRKTAVGYLDPNNQQKAQPGEKRIYARNSAGGQVVEVWLKNNGETVITNGSGTLVLQSSGEFNINGARITTGGDVVTAAGVSLNSHYHTQSSDSDGDAEQDTSAAVATE